MIIRVLLLASFLVGCAVPLPSSTSEGDWLSYGEQRALSGYKVQSKHELSQNHVLSQELYSVYLRGYETGKTAYCQQNPYALGSRKQSYFGICDDVDKFFRMKFEAGRSLADSRSRS
ncbi:DUF2799 domain-containing protein [Vibrio sp. Isolate24]|uniref:DUF2799 domain-containing protein n=1 Tax=Vibrio sp. Isolate24 TaxID=2908534 RepID=UPI001EFE4E49|nr:DUF2799 domain-containing protein [Vibrio sp. Isolate24]MCG9680743.1 DUF2799 domain-containing protein [Vibrio sp. Isolate24]